MSKKFEAIKEAVFYAKENPQVLADILNGVVSDVATKVIIDGATEITKGESSVTKDYTTKVLSQFGDEMSGQTVTLALNESVTGVSISSSTITVASTVTATSFKLKATCGTVIGYLTVTIK